ncbi:MAG: hypothetical protein ACFB5Z_12760 [Elainellaceae cyanobacterium]
MIKVTAALKFWLVFLLLFWAAGFSAVQSIFLGGLAGWTGGLLSKWWSVKAPPKDGDQDDDQDDDQNSDQDSDQNSYEEESLPKPMLALSRFLGSNSVGRTSAERHHARRSTKPSPGWFGPFGPPKK